MLVAHTRSRRARWRCSSNYSLTFVGANFTITAKPVTVTADPKSKVYGAADPALTYQVTSGSLGSGDS